MRSDSRPPSLSRRRLHEVANDFEVLQETVPSRESDEPLELWSKKAFTAILDEEEPSLRTVSDRVASLRVAVQAL